MIRESRREWVEGYLKWCGHLIESLDIFDDDPRLAMSVPISNWLPITLNQRNVLIAFYRGTNVIALMLPQDFAKLGGPAPFHAFKFKPWRDETIEDVPMLCFFRVDYPDELKPLRDAWLAAVMRELSRSWERSSYRKHHQSAFYRAAIDRPYRERLIDEAAALAEQGRRKRMARATPLASDSKLSGPDREPA